MRFVFDFMHIIIGDDAVLNNAETVKFGKDRYDIALEMN